MNSVIPDNDDAVDSEELLDVLLGKSSAGRKTYIEQNNGAVLAYIRGEWKYIEPAEGPALYVDVNIESGLSAQPQLYNLKKDSGERKNLATKFLQKVKEMAEVIHKIKSEVAAGKSNNDEQGLF